MDPMFILWSVGAPALAAFLAVGASFLASRRLPKSEPPRYLWLAAAAVGLAFAVGSPGILGRFPTWPPAQAAEWLPLLGLAAVFLGVIDTLVHRMNFSWIVLTLMLGLLAWGTIAGPLGSASKNAMGEGGVKAAWIAACAVLIILPALAARHGAAATTHAGPPVALGLLAGVSIGAIIALAHTAKFGQFVSLLGLGIAPFALMALIRGNWPIAPGVAPAFAALHSIMWLLTHFYAPRDGHWASTALACLAPAGLLVARIPALSRKPKAAGIAQAVACVAMGAAAAVVLVATAPEPPADDDDGASLYYGLSD
ncbi:MAG: hypothetical protein HRU70_08010 [Phycisphaeraceae bacterium]|nr:MAG: hypothetical protein HRU70_08010 [Phycisphaeraceae bacterium]